jgi:hypothetical protein
VLITAENASVTALDLRVQGVALYMQSGERFRSHPVSVDAGRRQLPLPDIV